VINSVMFFVNLCSKIRSTSKGSTHEKGTHLQMNMNPEGTGYDKKSCGLANNIQMTWDNLEIRWHCIQLQRVLHWLLQLTQKISHKGALARSKLNQVLMVGLTHLMPQTHPPSASQHSLAWVV
jgi:hypothetical protein